MVVEAYRDAYPAIAGTRTPSGFGRRGGLWKAIERAAQGAVEEGRERTAGYCRFNYDDDGHLLVELPSGRVMVYRNARLVRSWNETYQYEQTQLVYDAPKKPGERTYGGLLVENVVSAISRDLLAASMLACEREELPIVLHVHDEIVIEVPQAAAEASLRRLLEIMSTPPAWAEGFPIEVEGYCTERYLKSPPAGSLHGRARNGRLLG
jgi:DNA polymerase